MRPCHPGGGTTTLTGGRNRAYGRNASLTGFQRFARSSTYAVESGPT